MIELSHCKINLGLNIVARRADGYHDIQTVVYAIRSVADVVELQSSGQNRFTQSGLVVDCPPEKNLCVQALHLMQERYDVPPSHIHLHKQIPMGAGLGGGSANATAVLKLCNNEYRLNLSTSTLEQLAAELGSDTAFFVTQQPTLATGRGEILSPLPLPVDLSSYYIYILKPPVHISTAQAYAGITPKHPETPLIEIIAQPIEQWKNGLINDFEQSVFQIHPTLGQIKKQLYTAGAIYAAMSGSGSAIFGIFKTEPQIPFAHFWYKQIPK